MSRLFSHVASKINRSTEDLATEALCYLLESEDTLLEAFINHVNDVVDADLRPNMRLMTQKSITDGGRPDLVAWEPVSDGRKLLVESKFSAGLTSKQPTEYLGDLDGMKGSVLLFLVPERRRASVWREVKCRCAVDSLDFTAITGGASVLFGNGTRMGITTWSLVLDALEQAIPDDDPKRIHEDVRQLRALCEREGAGGFRPFEDGDFAPWVAERILDLHSVVDDIHGQLFEHSDSWSPSTGPRLSNMNYRFRAHLYDCKVGIGIRYRWWAKEEHSPFWARLHFDDPHVQARVHEALDWHHPTLNGGDAGPQDVLVPLTVKRQANRRIVVRHILDQLNTIADCLQLVLKQDG